MVVLSVAVPQKEVSITGHQADPISRLAAGGPRPMEGPMAGRSMPLWSPQMTNPWVSTGWPIDMMTSSNRNISRVTGPLCVSNHLRIDCLLNRLFRRRSKKTSKLLLTGLCEGNRPVTASIWWRHHDVFSLDCNYELLSRLSDNSKAAHPGDLDHVVIWNLSCLCWDFHRLSAFFIVNLVITSSKLSLDNYYVIIALYFTGGVCCASGISVRWLCLT